MKSLFSFVVAVIIFQSGNSSSQFIGPKFIGPPIPVFTATPTPVPTAAPVSTVPWLSRVIPGASCYPRQYGFVTGDVATCFLWIDAPQNVEFDFARMPDVGSAMNGFEIRNLDTRIKHFGQITRYTFEYSLQAFQVFQKTTSVPFSPIEVACRERIGKPSFSDWQVVQFPAIRISVGQVSDFNALNPLEPTENAMPPKISPRAYLLCGAGVLIFGFSAWWIARVARRDRERRKSSPFLWALDSLRKASELNACVGQATRLDLDALALEVFAEAIKRKFNVSGAETGDAISVIISENKYYAALALRIKMLWDARGIMFCSGAIPQTESATHVFELLSVLVARECREVRRVV